MTYGLCLSLSWVFILSKISLCLSCCSVFSAALSQRPYRSGPIAAALSQRPYRSGPIAAALSQRHNRYA